MKHVAIVTGAAGYVGSAVARELAERGMVVALFYHRTEPSLDVLPGEGHRAYQVDLTDADAVEAALEAVTEELGTPVVAVHAAGLAPTRKKFLDSSAAEVRAQFEQNAFAGFNFLTACARGMKQAGKGTLIGITTQAIANPESGRGLGAYVPAKQALKSMLEQLALELSPSGVSVREIAPGFMDGGMNASLPRAFIEMQSAAAPDGKLMTAGDVAAEVLRVLTADAILAPS